MREFLAWREAHSTRKNTAEKHAGVQLDDDDDEVDDDAEDDPSGDNTEEEVNNDGKGVPPKGAVDVTGGMIGIPDEGNSGEQEWTVEVEEVAARIEHRRVSTIYPPPAIPSPLFLFLLSSSPDRCALLACKGRNAWVYRCSRSARSREGKAFAYTAAAPGAKQPFSSFTLPDILPLYTEVRRRNHSAHAGG